MTQSDAAEPSAHQQDEGLLDEISVLPYLAERGFGSRPETSAERLTGGVSNVVLRAALRDGDLVVKQALSRLAVEEDRFADRGRSHTEAEALSYLEALLPGFTPPLLDDDPENYARTIKAAPRDWDTLKTALMAGDVPVTQLGRLGLVLREWHLRSGRDVRSGTIPTVFDSPLAFRQLRLDPCFKVSAQRLPDLSASIGTVAAALALVVDGIHHVGLEPGSDVGLALDVAATNFQNADGDYSWASEGRNSHVGAACSAGLRAALGDRAPEMDA